MRGMWMSKPDATDERACYGRAMKTIAIVTLLLVGSDLLGRGLLGHVVWAAPPKPHKASPADAFLDFYNSLYAGLTRGAQEAQWGASTDVSDAHEGERTGANTLLAIFQGDKAVIES